VKNSLFFIFTSLCLSEYTLINIDASSYEDWVYFSFSIGEIVDIEDPENSNDWDLGLMRNHFRTNSGSSGNCIGGAYMDSTSVWTEQNWDEMIEVPEGALFIPDGTLNTIYDLETHDFSDASGSLILENWGWVDLDNNYQFNYNNYIFIIRTALGEYVKFWPYSYYNEQDYSGHISIAYETGIPNNYCSNSGDVNYDSILDILDIIIIRDHIIGAALLSSSGKCEGDINFDSFTDLLDIVAVINSIL